MKWVLVFAALLQVHRLFLLSILFGIVSAHVLQHVLEPGLFKRATNTRGETNAMMVEFGSSGQLIVSSKKNRLELKKTFFEGSDLIGFKVSGLGRGEATFKVLDSFLLKSRIDDRSVYWRSSRSEKLISNETLQSRLQASIVVSYVLHSPRKATAHVSTQCVSNLLHFLKHGVLSSYHGVHIVFNLIGDTPKFLALAQLESNQSNVEIKRHDNMGIDLFIQGEVIREFLTIEEKKSTPEHFVCLSCGARGPYFYEPKSTSAVWTTAFTSRLKNRIKAVGSSISCEGARHIQTYAIAFDRNGAKLASDLWTSDLGFDKRNANKSTLIDVFEVGLGAKFAASGYLLASLGHDCENATAKHAASNSLICQINQTARHNRSIGCEGVEPCKVVFVKFGGQVLRSNLIPQVTRDRVALQEETSCGRFPLRPVREVYDFPLILDRICSPGLGHSDSWMCRDAIDADFVVLIRSHLGYLLHTLSMLYNFEAQLSSHNESTKPTIFVGIIPLERGIWQEIDETVKKRFYGGRQLIVRTLPYPSLIYKDYGNELKTLCSGHYLQRLTDEYSAGEISRYCKIDSPKHYFLVDLTIEWLRRQCKFCRYMLVTNGDNFYSYQFFSQIARHAIDNPDVIYFDFVEKNWALYNAVLRRSGTDLGAYLVTFDLLKSHNLSFLGSLPTRVTARHYHDADGYFIESVLGVPGGVKANKVSKLLYFHE